MSKLVTMLPIDVKPSIREEIEKIAAESGVQVFYLDGKQINSKEKFLNKAAEAMQFPQYFGANWDAFDECINDLTWCPANKYIIFYDNASIFAQSDPIQYQIALDILSSAQKNWESRNADLIIYI